MFKISERTKVSFISHCSNT